MSGIYISGMEMPTSCFQCEFRTKIDPDNLMCIISQKSFEERFYHIENRDKSCPLVPVPEHGRLIDADALADMLEKYKNKYAIEAGDKKDFGIMQKAFGFHDAELIAESLPTIIPADKEGET